MNEKAIVKHFAGRWKAELTYVASRASEEWFLVTDGYVILRLPPDHLLFDSRRMFPDFPEEGDTFSYAKGRPSMPSEMPLPQTYSRWANNQTLLPAEATNWLREYNGGLIRAFLLPDKQRVFVDEDFIAMLLDKDETVESFTYLAAAMPAGEGDEKLPVVVQDEAGEVVACLMLMTVYEQGELFAIATKAA